MIGDEVAGFTPQESIADSLAHTGRDVEVTWFATDALAPDALGRFDGVWCAPGSPYRSFEGALAGIRYAREEGIPFIGTCAGFQHAVIEFARNVAGLTGAGHAEYGPGSDLIIDELYCSLVGQVLRLRMADDWVRSIYGADEVDERYYCRFGLNEAYRDILEQHGLVCGAVDAADGSTRILRLAAHPFFVVTLFVPQTRSAPDAPHPLIEAFAAAL